MKINDLRNWHSRILLLSMCGFILLLSGCATIPEELPRQQQKFNVPGVYHKVLKGQTLWRISKLYDFDLEELARINRISDNSSIEVGQLIFIPNRKSPRTETTPVQSKPSDDFIWPLRGKIISSFGQNYNNLVSKGINIQPLSSSKDIVATRSGKVIFYSDNFGMYGKTFIIDHQDGFFSVYARNALVFVKVGDFIQRGSIVSKAGAAS